MSTASRIRIVCLALALLSLGLVTAYGEESQEQREADWRTLAKLSVQYVGDFDSQGKFTRGGGAYMAAYWPWKAAFVPFWADFQKRYGSTWESVKPHFDGMGKPKGVPQGIEYVFNKAIRIDIPKHEQQMAKWAEGYAQSQHKSWKRLYDQNHENVEVMMKQADRSAGFMRLAARLNPAGDYAAGIQAGDDAVEKTLPRYKAHLKTKEWPAHNASYQGTDQPDALAAAALAFLQEHPDWTAPEFDDEHVPVAAVVSGSEWKVYKKEWLTGAPLQYSIKMLVAFTGKKHPDLAYCYYMELYTSEGLGVKPALPFEYANSRQFESYRMLREKLPK